MQSPQSLLARYAFQILEQLALDLPLRACPDMVNGFDQQIDQAIRYRAALHISECCEPSQPLGFGVSPHFKRCLDCNPLPIALQLLGRRVIEAIRRQFESTD